MRTDIRKYTGWRLFLLMLLGLLAIPLPGAAQDDHSSYRLTPGDSIRTFVLGEPELSIEAKLDRSGTIFFPLLGVVDVKGLTEQETEAKLTELLSGDYLVDPQITVNIIGFRQYYLQGAVIKPGPYPYKPGLTVGRAIAEAGGFNERASKSKIYVVKEADPNAEQEKASTESLVEPGDIITVNESFF